MGGALIGRLFYEIGGDQSKLNDSLAKAMKAAESANLKITRAGQGIIAAFDNALNPTKRLEEELKLLELAGKSTGDVIAVMGQRIKSATDTATANGQAIPDIVKKYSDLGKEGAKSRLSIEALGKGLTDFARSPVESAKAGVSGFLGTLGPTAVGLAGVTTAAGLAGAAIFTMGKQAADAAEQVDNLSKQTGLTFQEVRSLQRLGEETGLGDLTDTIARLNQQLGSKEGGDFVEALLAIPGAMDAVNGSSLDAVSALDLLRERYIQIPDPVKRAQTALAELGAKNREILPLVLNTSQGIKEAMDEIGKSGIGMSDASKESLLELDRQLDVHGRAWEGLKTRIGVWAGEITLSVFKMVEKAEPLLRRLINAMPTAGFGGGVMPSGPPVSGGAGGGGGWGGSGDITQGTTGGLTELDRRREQISRAEATASGVRKDLLDVTGRLGEAERVLAAEIAKKGGRQFDAEALQQAAERVRALRDEKAALEDVRKQLEAFDDALNPVARLTKEFRTLEAAGRSSADILAVHGDRLIAATAAAFDHGKSVSDATVKYLEMKLEATRMEKAQKPVISQWDVAAKNTLPNFGAKLAETRDVLVDLGEAGGLFLQGIEVWAKEAIPPLDDVRQKWLDLARVVDLEPIGKSELERHRQELENLGVLWDDTGRRMSDSWRTHTDSILGLTKDLWRNLKAVFSGDFTSVGGIFDSLKGLLGGRGTGSATGSTGSFWDKLFGKSIKTDKLTGLGLLGLGGVGGASSGMFGRGATGKILGGTVGALGAGLGLSASTFGLGTAGATGFGSTLTGALLTNPWGWLALAGLGAGLGISKLARGKNAWQAGGKESMRDFGVDVSGKAFEDWAKGLGLTESQTYPIRKDLMSSPLFLTQVAGPAAEAQGKMDDFLRSLEAVKTSWGTFNFRDAFELGDLTGDWSELDRVFKEAFDDSAALQKQFPDWQEKLLLGGEAAKDAAVDFAALFAEFQKTGQVSDEFQLFMEENATLLDTAAMKSSLLADQILQVNAALLQKPTVDGLKALKAALEADTTAASDMYMQFFETGEITEEFAAKIEELGGDLSRFEELSRLADIQKEFDDLADTFRETGEILPRLRNLFEEFGGDLAALDSAASLPGLYESLDSLEEFADGLERLLDTMSPIQQVLAGEWGADTWGELFKMGLDPSKFTGVTDLIKFTKDWDKARADFEKTGKLVRGGTLEQALFQFGGAEGKRALEQLRNGDFNTITPGLLDKTKAALDKAQKDELNEALDYLGEQTEKTNKEIDDLNATVEDQLSIVSQSITDALDSSKLAVVAELDKMLAVLKDIALNTESLRPAAITLPTPDTATGGESDARDGGYEQFALAGAPEIHVHMEGANFGRNAPEDIRHAVEDAFIDLRRRGALSRMSRI